MRAHWVQESYLKAWCDPDSPAHHEPYVWVFDKDARVGKKRAPKKLFTLPDFYKDRRGKNDNDPMWLETGLSKIESEFIRVRDTVIVAGKALSEEDQAILTTYVGLSFVRTPKYLEFAAEPWRHTVRIMDDMRESFARLPPGSRPSPIVPLGGRDPSQEISEEAAREAASHPNQTLIAPLVKVQARILAKMRCMLLMTGQEPGFITSDSPCVHFNRQDFERPSFYQSGMVSPSHEVTFPIIPGCLAFYGWSSKEEHNGTCGYADAPDEVVAEMNWRTRAFCHDKFVVRRDCTRDHWFDHGVRAEP